MKVEYKISTTVRVKDQNTTLIKESNPHLNTTLLLKSSAFIHKRAQIQKDFICCTSWYDCIHNTRLSVDIYDQIHNQVHFLKSRAKEMAELNGVTKSLNRSV